MSLAGDQAGLARSAPVCGGRVSLSLGSDNGSFQSATLLAQRINAGQLPVPLQVVEVRSFGTAPE